jgi:hypothetical protein
VWEGSKRGCGGIYSCKEKAAMSYRLGYQKLNPLKMTCQSAKKEAKHNPICYEYYTEK